MILAGKLARSGNQLPGMSSQDPPKPPQVAPTKPNLLNDGLDARNLTGTMADVKARMSGGEGIFF